MYCPISYQNSQSQLIPAKVSHIQSANTWRELYSRSNLGQQIQRHKQEQKENYIKNRTRITQNIQSSDTSTEIFKTLQPNRYYGKERNFAFCDSTLPLRNQSTIPFVNSPILIQQNQKHIKLIEQQVENLQNLYLQNLNKKIVILNDKVQESVVEQVEDNSINHLNPECEMQQLVQQIDQFDLHMSQQQSQVEMLESHNFIRKNNEDRQKYYQQQLEELYPELQQSINPSYSQYPQQFPQQQNSQNYCNITTQSQNFIQNEIYNHDQVQDNNTYEAQQDAYYENYMKYLAMQH
ncbi:hypothetical protein SS50377_28088 [Spironucleus salmonicida]|uniref:Uncharacterized protein n=1 Tax=Spironucleus salmonicida TaxID=348837 RepID=V6LPI7_9EUKA|nr:hypothetical protein SS50377_28088 [Spironucleus salmonicida]|eukprot:EST42639.1 Hypothetical protein SS50377_17959 [Spironucleus salmonicida]